MKELMCFRDNSVEVYFVFILSMTTPEETN